VNVALIIAAGLSLLTWGIHTFVGGPRIAGPLLRSALPMVPKYTSYYCWHLVTIVLLAMAAGFAYAAFVPSGLDVAWLATLLALAFMGWSVALAFGKVRRPLHLPQWLLFLTISVAALVGLA